VQISNHTSQGSGNILLNGVIDNPVGATYIDAGAGSILQESTSAIVRTENLSMFAGKDIGSPVFQIRINSPILGAAAVGQNNPIEIEFVQSLGRVPFANFSAGGNLAIDVTTRLRDPGVSASTVNIHELLAKGTIQATFHDAALDTVLDYLLPSSVPAGIVVGAESGSPNDGAGISTNKFYKSFYYPDTFGPLSTDVLSAFGTNSYFGLFSFTAPATYNIAYGSSINVGFQGFLSRATQDVAINQLAGPAPFASLLVPSLNMSAVVPPLISGSATTTSVTLSVPMVSTAIETPLEQILGQAQTTFFGVTETDLVTLAAAAALQPSSNLLEEDFLALEPGLLPIDGFTKPNMVWS